MNLNNYVAYGLSFTFLNCLKIVRRLPLFFIDQEKIKSFREKKVYNIEQFKNKIIKQQELPSSRGGVQNNYFFNRLFKTKKITRRSELNL